MSALSLCAFSYQNRALRVVQDHDGEPLFHVGDLCAILGYSNPRDALRRHVSEEDVVKRDTLTAGGTQQANFVREPGMWALILGSETEAAKPVKRWVTAEVLPSIRKTGAYAVPGASTAPLAAIMDEVKSLRSQVSRLQRVADQRLLSSPAKRKPRFEVVRDQVAAYIARHRPWLVNVDMIGAEVLHKTNLTPEERRAILAGLKQMGYAH